MTHGHWQALRRYSGALAMCALVSAACSLLLDHLNPANIIMLYLSGVVLVAVYLGQGPAILAALCSVALFDFLFVPPRFSLTVHDGQYLLTFAIMLLVALLISHLATRLQHQLEDSRKREQLIGALYNYARQLAGAMTHAEVIEGLQRCLRDSFSGKLRNDTPAILLLPDRLERLTVPADLDQQLVHMAYQSGEVLTGECGMDGNDIALYLPLRGSTRPRGVLVVSAPATEHRVLTHEREFFLALASLTVTAVERLHFVEIARSTELDMVSERLRSSILSALSHDIRTPLTVMCGLADTLKLTRGDISASSLEIIEALRSQAFRLHSMVENLLDMARLQCGKVSLRREWQPLEEVIGSSINHLSFAMTEHPVHVKVDPDLLLEIDAVLMERVFCNVLENACKYSPAGSAIAITANKDGDFADVVIHNLGSRFPVDNAELLLEMFARGQRESATQGFGLGLAICRSVVEAHGGSLRVFNPPEGGACVAFTLPLGEPPRIEPEMPISAANA